jgi:hypothetical protein
MNSFVRIHPPVRLYPRLVAGLGMLLVLRVGLLSNESTLAEDQLLRPIASQSVDSEYLIPPAKMMGATSCAASSCHGGGRIDFPGSEYTTWTEGDPHFNAFRVLFNSKSTSMIKAMNRTREIPLPVAHENALCLKCHSSEPAISIPNDLEQNLRSSAAAYSSDQARIHRSAGVGCESCHGPAEKYLSQHYLPSWKQLSSKQKAEQFGLWPTKEISSRVQVCTSCHVGNADQQVNHDLIAAGHPRLTFEYTSHHHHPAYRRHWQEKSPKGEFEIHAWLISQFAVARASVALQESRAVDAIEHQATWPELAEYSCFSCHQDLSNGEKFSQLNQRSNREPGSIPWQTWSTRLVPSLMKESPWLDVKPLQVQKSSLERLIEETTVPSQRTPSPSSILRLTKEAKRELDFQIRSIELSLPKARNGKNSAAISSRLIPFLAKDLYTADQAFFRDQDWDTITQHYLGLVAMRYAQRVLTPKHPIAGIDGSLWKLKSLLQFPNGYDSPANLSIPSTWEEFRNILHLSGTHELSKH